jgi:hypothetical protein
MENGYLPVVIDAKYKQDYIIEVEFDNGVKKLINFAPWLQGEVFEALKDQRYFRQFFVDGWTVAWPNGADIAPETLYEAEDVLEEELTPEVAST